MDSTTQKIAPEPVASHSLWYALEAGLPMRMAYTVDETALYSGLSVNQLRAAMKAGELDFIKPRGTVRGARIPVAAMDRYMDCSQPDGCSA